MTNEEFDNLWHHAEAKGTAHRLAQEYPAWDKRHRRFRGGMMVALIAGAVTATTLPLLRPAVPKDYVAVYCNRSGVDETQWVTLASEMLTTDMI